MQGLKFLRNRGLFVHCILAVTPTIDRKHRSTLTRDSEMPPTTLLGVSSRSYLSDGGPGGDLTEAGGPSGGEGGSAVDHGEEGGRGTPRGPPPVVIRHFEREFSRNKIDFFPVCGVGVTFNSIPH